MPNISLPPLKNDSENRPAKCKNGRGSTVTMNYWPIATVRNQFDTTTNLVRAGLLYFCDTKQGRSEGKELLTNGRKIIDTGSRNITCESPPEHSGGLFLLRE